MYTYYHMKQRLKDQMEQGLLKIKSYELNYDESDAKEGVITFVNANWNEELSLSQKSVML